MWNPGIDRSNRKARRAAMKYNNAGDPNAKNDWQKEKRFYQPIYGPMDLGIKRFKRAHPGQNKLIRRYKEEAWDYIAARQGESSV